MNPLDLDFFSDLCLRHTQSSVPHSELSALLPDAEKRHFPRGYECSRSAIYRPGLPLEGVEVQTRVSKGTAQGAWLQRGPGTLACVP